MNPETLSTTLLTRLRKREPEAWERATHLYAPLVFAWCRRQGVPESAVEDVVQEVFTAVARALPNFRRDRPGDSFRGWLATITRNKVLDCFRRMQKQPCADGGTKNLDRMHNAAAEDQTVDFDSDYQPSERRLIIRRAAELVRAEFEPTTWDAFHLTTVEGMAPQAASERLGVSVNAVYKARSRVLRRLRSELDGLL